MDYKRGQQTIKLLLLLSFIFTIGCQTNETVSEVATVTQAAAPQISTATDTVPPITAVPIPTNTVAPTPSPTSLFPTIMPLEEWLVYENVFYGYQLSYPPNASVDTSGVLTYPQEDKPAGVSHDDFLVQLQETYPGDICVFIRYMTGFVSILAPMDNGGRYGSPCGTTGVGAEYDIVEKTEEVAINGASYTAEGIELWSPEQNRAVRELMYFHLPDGTQIHYGRAIGFSDEDGVKEVLLQIMSTFQYPENKSQNLPLLIFQSNGHLHRTNVDNDFDQQLTNEPESAEDINLQTLHPHVSPDGMWLALGGKWGGSAFLNIANGSETGIGRGRAMRVSTWSPDSQRVAYLGHNNQLCFYRLADEATNCPFKAENELLVAKWSPNGEYVAVVVLETAVSTECCLAQVWLFNTLTEEAEIVGNLTVTLEPVVERLLRWLPNSGGLLIHSETNRLPDALYSLEDQAAHLFTEPVRDVAPNGRFLLYESGKIGNINGDVFFDLPTVESSACPREERPIRSWVWSADGEQIAYTLRCPASDEGENWLIIVEAATGDKQWEINLPTNLSLNSWTPDNSSLLLNEYSPLPEEWAIWQISSDGQNPPEKILSQAILLSYVPAWNKE